MSIRRNPARLAALMAPPTVAPADDDPNAAAQATHGSPAGYAKARSPPGPSSVQRVKKRVFVRALPRACGKALLRPVLYEAAISLSILDRSAPRRRVL